MYDFRFYQACMKQTQLVDLLVMNNSLNMLEKHCFLCSLYVIITCTLHFNLGLMMYMEGWGFQLAYLWKRPNAKELVKEELVDRKLGNLRRYHVNVKHMKWSLWWSGGRNMSPCGQQLVFLLVNFFVLSNLKWTWKEFSLG